MTIRAILFAGGLTSATVAGAAAQQAQAPSATPPAGQMQMMMMPFELPEACKAAVQGGQAQMQGMQGMQPMQGGQGMQAMPQGQGMQGMMMQNMQGMMANMPEAQKESMQAMMRMGPAMMQGMMAKEPELAWACAMIPHHLGAIEMSKAVLKHASDAEIKKMAEKTVKEQEKDVSELKDWLQKRTKK